MDCIYCGAPADTKDHIIPLTYLYNGRPKNPKGKGETVDCCRECNTLLGAKALFSVAERAEYLANALERRYRKVLKAPYWSDEEIEELDGELKQTIKAKQFLREEILERVRNCVCVAQGILEQALPLWKKL